MGNFLSAIGSALTGGVSSGIGSGIAGVVSKLFGPSPNEQATQSINNTNRYLRETVGARAGADLTYMDTVYPGTSPWERLGSSAAAPIQAQDSGSSREAALLPLLTAQMQASTQRAVAEKQQETALGVAKINQDTELFKNNQNTNNGEVPRKQAALLAAEEVLAQARTLNTRQDTELKGEQTKTEGYKQQQLDWSAINLYNDVLLKRAEKMFSLLPREQVDLGLYSVEARPGAEKIMEWLNSKDTGGTSQISFDDLVRSMPKDEWSAVIRDGARIAGSLGGIAKSGMQGMEALRHVKRTVGYLKG